MQVVSGAERPLSHPLITSLVELPEQRLDEAIREAARSGILVIGDDDYRFRHALLREAVHDDLLPGERARLHRAYAEALEAQCAGSDSSDAAALAYHWQLAQNDRKALVAAADAMRHAKGTVRVRECRPFRRVGPGALAARARRRRRGPHRASRPAPGARLHPAQCG
ncbi:hypothetical protein JM654_05400 [Microbacterium oxydans]|nr:hypothetical protein [Microbacterium oxydans]